MTYVYHVWMSFVGNILFNLTVTFSSWQSFLSWQALLVIQLICLTNRSQLLLCKSIIDGHVCLHVNFSILLMTTTDACLWLVELSNTRAFLNKWLGGCSCIQIIICVYMCDGSYFVSWAAHNTTNGSIIVYSVISRTRRAGICNSLLWNNP